MKVRAEVGRGGEEGKGTERRGGEKESVLLATQCSRSPPPHPATVRPSEVLHGEKHLVDLSEGLVVLFGRSRECF